MGKFFSKTANGKLKNVNAPRFLAFLAVFLPAFDTVFNLGVWFVHSALNGFDRGWGDVVFYQEQGWFLWIYLFCVVGGLASWLVAMLRGVSVRYVLMFTMIFTATISGIWQFLVTFASYQ